MKLLPQPPLLVITDRKQTERPLLQVAASLFAGGCRWLSLREPDLGRTERVSLLYRLVNLGERSGATVGVHADFEAAMTTGAAGVHLPRHGSISAARDYLGVNALIGISTHDRNEVQHALALGADYVTLSPIFESPSKPDYGPALGLKTLSDIAKTLDIPILALGGIDRSNIAECIEAGAAGAAIMGGAMRAADPETMIREVVTSLGDALVSAQNGGHSSV